MQVDSAVRPCRIELRSIRLGTEANPVLREVSLRLLDSRCALVMGSTGSGKSSLLKIAAGIMQPEEGEVLFDGRPLDSFGRRELTEFHRRCGFVFQDAALWANQSLFENVAFPLRFHHPSLSAAEVETEVRRAVDLAGYGKRLSVRPAEISGGERHLVGLARALVLDPEILFLDEPTASLDEEEAAHLIELVIELGRRGRAILMASSNPDLAYRVADEVGVLARGTIAAWGSYDEAVVWTDPALRGVTGRLKPRRSQEGLLGAWESALSSGGEAGPE